MAKRAAAEFAERAHGQQDSWMPKAAWRSMHALPYGKRRMKEGELVTAPLALRAALGASGTLVDAEVGPGVLSAVYCNVHEAPSGRDRMAYHFVSIRADLGRRRGRLRIHALPFVMNNHVIERYVERAGDDPGGFFGADLGAVVRWAGAMACMYVAGELSGSTPVPFRGGLIMGGPVLLRCGPMTLREAMAFGTPPEGESVIGAGSLEVRSSKATTAVLSMNPGAVADPAWGPGSGTPSVVPAFRGSTWLPASRLTASQIRYRDRMGWILSKRARELDDGFRRMYLAEEGEPLSAVIDSRRGLHDDVLESVAAYQEAEVKAKERDAARSPPKADGAPGRHMMAGPEQEELGAA
jgi:hypothetical protein